MIFGAYMNKNKVKKIATWIIVPLMASFFILDIITVVIGNRYADGCDLEPENFSYEYGNDRIHFLNTANSDCILLESNGRFALVDSGEGSFNPRRKEGYKGFEEDVIAYLKKVAGGSQGNVTLDFILGTHYHYDHIGCFHAIINDKDISISKAYFKKFTGSNDREFEVDRWGLASFYDQIVDDLNKNDIELVNDIPDSIVFGDFYLKLYNTECDSGVSGEGENSNSIGIKVTKKSLSAFLAADITGPSGVEDKIKGTVGHCDLLKIGHHGYYGSSSRRFLKEISPNVAIVTNYQGKVYPNVKWNLTMYSHTPFFGTYDYNGLIANFTDYNEIKLTYNIQ